MQKILILSLILFYFSSCDKKENNNDIKESETKFKALWNESHLLFNRFINRYKML